GGRLRQQIMRQSPDMPIGPAGACPGRVRAVFPLLTRTPVGLARTCGGALPG
ncbi:hypothetical protein GA0115252_10451, partial [Streptomyces sp. DfronAA-171]